MFPELRLLHSRLIESILKPTQCVNEGAHGMVMMSAHTFEVISADDS